MWDLGREDDALVATTGMGSDSHREPVTKVIGRSVVKQIISVREERELSAIASFCKQKIKLW